MDKIKHISTSKCNLLAVMVPEGAEAWRNETYHVNTLWYKTDSMRYPKHINLPEGNWQPLGVATELTEEEWMELIPCELMGGIGGVGMQWLYPDYQRSNCDGYDTAKESGLSLLEANKITEPTLLLRPL